MLDRGASEITKVERIVNGEREGENGSLQLGKVKRMNNASEMDSVNEVRV